MCSVQITEMCVWREPVKGINAGNQAPSERIIAVAIRPVKVPRCVAMTMNRAGARHLNSLVAVLHVRRRFQYPSIGLIWLWFFFISRWSNGWGNYRCNCGGLLLLFISGRGGGGGPHRAIGDERNNS